MKNKKILKIMGAIILVIIIAIVCLFVFKSKEIPAYIVKFDSVGGTEIEEQIVEEGAMVKKPEDPKKEGYLFVEWLLNEVQYDFNVPVNEDITLIANWFEVVPEKEMVTVSFNTDGGTTIANAIIEKGNKVEIPANPVREGYTFVQWTLNGNMFDFETAVTENIELIAQWEKVNTTIPNNTANNNTIENKIVVKTPILSNIRGGKGWADLNIVSEGVYANSTSEISGYELYEKNGSQYTLIHTDETTFGTKVTVDIGESKTYVARVYALDKNNKKVYSDYSNEIKIDNSKVETPILSNPTGGQGWGNLNIVSEGAYLSGTSEISGYELYEKNGSQYTLIHTSETTFGAKVTVDIGESKIYVARVYVFNKSNVKIYSNYSNEIKIDNSKIETPTLTKGTGGQGWGNLNIISEGAYVSGTSGISGYELYEKNGSQYTLIHTSETTFGTKVTVDIGESKTYVARVYALNKNDKKVYSDYSNEIKIDNSKIETPTLTKGTGGQGWGNLNIISEGAYVSGTSGISGYELYEKNESQYTLIHTSETVFGTRVTVDSGESKTYVARVYAYNKSNVKVYSGYSNEIKIDN